MYTQNRIYIGLKIIFFTCNTVYIYIYHYIHNISRITCNQIFNSSRIGKQVMLYLYILGCHLLSECIWFKKRCFLDA